MSIGDADLGVLLTDVPLTVNHIAVHTFTCVLALQIAHLMRLTAEQAGHHLSVRAIREGLAGIGETVLIYPSTGGRPKARRITTDLNTEQAATWAAVQGQPLTVSVNVSGR